MEEKHVLFGKYEMGKLLGKGTFAKVYHGKVLTTGESVAIKSSTKIRIMATNKDLLCHGVCPWGELFAKVYKGKLKEHVARKYFQQLISAVDFCHSRGVSHRDLKPDNLLLDENEDLKISDFGLSALPEQILNDGLLHTQCGTPAYVAPEVSCHFKMRMMKMYRKVFKAEFEFPCWFSTESRRLISKLLVSDPEKRITIDAIMLDPWFRKEFTRPPAFSIEESIKDDESTVSKNVKQSSPKFFNAFELISWMSSGFDLSTVAKGMNFKVGKAREEFKMRLQRPSEGRKGRLSMTAEVFEVAPEVAIVEFAKSTGDTLEYAKFCEEDVRPALKDIVWTWQGDSFDIASTAASDNLTVPKN
ncbi:CBL-interacting serine/threonine-protein kinase 25 [Hibiscus syriacus]|uniref:CBL-interacting serine/threonine-protein kinase 25 n=1 Tax=Hibiscus syriacus TaxID=106335 RepID=A0A6A2Z704_HIBSY|nr:CBL-interacting serine/threonine-protein kinase 25 [Hibiscus syriacus]